MFSSRSGLEYKYDLSAPKFRLAFEFLKRPDLEQLEPQWIELGQGVRASIQCYDSFDWEDNMFETHERFFDVQYVVRGQEFCGVCAKDGLTVAVPYNKADDVTFYKDPGHFGKVLLKAGDFIVLAPEDAHKPRCAVDKSIPVRKVVVKVPV